MIKNYQKYNIDNNFDNFDNFRNFDDFRNFDENKRAPGHEKIHDFMTNHGFIKVCYLFWLDVSSILIYFRSFLIDK